MKHMQERFSRQMEGYGNNESLQLMQDNVPPIKYMELLAEWAADIRNNELVEDIQRIAHLQEAMKELNHPMMAEKSFDDGIEQAACFLLNTLQFSQLQGGFSYNSRRKGLSKVADYLYVQGLISRIGIKAFKAQIQQGVIDKIAKFLQFTQNTSTSKEALYDIWHTIFHYSSEQLQQFLQVQKIKLKDYPFLFRLAEISIELSIQHAKSNYFIRFLREGQAYFSIPEAVVEQKQQEISSLLIRVVKQKSLFLGEQYETILPLLESFPSCLSKVLALEDISLLRLAGPLFDRSLLGESIELSLNYSGEFEAFLRYLQKAFKNNKANWLNYWQLGEGNKLLMLSIDKLPFEKIFNIPNVKTLIVYFNIEERQDCVQTIAAYVKQSEILVFCLLVKVWWKNMENKKKLGKITLSSHALMLMALFYLYQSSQILPVKYSPGKLSISPRNLFSQFVGFLKYYGPNGEFDKLRPLIGICKGSEIAEANFIINLRGCSCGDAKTWLSRGYSDIIDEIFQNSRATLASCDPQRICSLFYPK